MIPVPLGLGGGGPEPRSPPVRERSQACALARGLRGTGRRPSPAALSRLSSGLSGAGAGQSAAIARSPGKDDLSTVRPKATTRLGFSNELGSRPHRRSEFCFVFQALPRLSLFAIPNPIPADSRSATFPGSAFWRPILASW